MSGMQEQQKKMFIAEQIQAGNYGEALRALKQYYETNYNIDEETCILAGSIYHGLNERESEWKAICEGLQYNPFNAELYVMLGNYYLESNLQQAYLCYENALFYARETEDYIPIQQLLQDFTENYKVKVPKVAFVILSYNLLDYTKQCIESIRANVLDSVREIIIVDNASHDGSVEWLREQKDIIVVENKENAGFPKGCNQGIAMASEEADIFLLNNDTILPPNALFWLRMGLYANEKNGTAGSVSNYVSNLQQVAQDKQGVEEMLAFAKRNNIPMEYPCEPKLFLIGFALLIKRTAMEQVGVLDERFTPGNSEDVDYGLRMLQAGYQNVLCKNSFILHFGSRSFGKLGKEFSTILNHNQEKLNAKWGMDLQYYMYPRMELVSLIEEEIHKPLRILDIGCGCGAIMAKIKGSYPNAVTYGIEIVPEAAKLALNIGRVICQDVEELEFPYPDNYFDYCIMGDVLEHLREPGKVLRRLYRHIKDNGKIIVSMPNMKHWSVLLPLLRQDRFSYADSGILDRTHLKMYTGTEIQYLVNSSGYSIDKLMYTMFGKPSEEEEILINQLVNLMENPNKVSIMAYQFIVRAVKRS